MRYPISLSLSCALALSACGGASDSPSGPSSPTPTPVVVSTVAVSGATTVEAGKTISLSAAAKDASGATISGKTFTWTSSNDAIASVASDGTVTGKAPGTASISAAVDGKSGSASVTVTAALPVVASITISGTTAVQAGATTKLTATVKHATGAAISSVPVTWSSADPTLITVGSDGTVNAAHIATVTITAAAGGKTATADVVSTLTPYTFNFPDASAADAQRIKDAVQGAHAFFQKTFGRTITKPTTVTGATTAQGCDSRSGNAAFTQPQAVTFCVANQGWTANSPLMRQKITIHELFHVWQYEDGWLGNGRDGATWVVEGSAELVGFSGLDAMGLMPIATARGCQVKQATDFNTQRPPGFPSLSAFETPQQFQSFQGPLYTISFMGMDQLTANAGGLASLKTYGDAIAAGSGPNAWIAAFTTAFGTTPSAFYAQFQSYFNAQPVPPNFLCG